MTFALIIVAFLGWDAGPHVDTSLRFSNEDLCVAAANQTLAMVGKRNVNLLVTCIKVG